MSMYACPNFNLCPVKMGSFRVLDFSFVYQGLLTPRNSNFSTGGHIVKDYRLRTDLKTDGFNNLEIRR